MEYISELIIAAICSFITDPLAIQNFRLTCNLFKNIGAKNIKISENDIIGIKNVNYSRDQNNKRMKWLIKLMEVALHNNNHDTICQLEILFYEIVYEMYYRPVSFKKARNMLVKTLSLFYNHVKWLFNEIKDNEYYLPDISNIELSFNFCSMYYSLNLTINFGEAYQIDLNTSTVNIDYNGAPDLSIKSFRYPELIIKSQYNDDINFEISNNGYYYCSCFPRDDNLYNLDIILNYQDQPFDKYDDFEDYVYNPINKKKKLNKISYNNRKKLKRI